MKSLCDKICLTAEDGRIWFHLKPKAEDFIRAKRGFHRATHDFINITWVQVHTKTHGNIFFVRLLQKIRQVSTCRIFLSKPQAWHIIATQSWISSAPTGLYLITRQRASTCGLMIFNTSCWWYTRLTPWWYTRLRRDVAQEFESLLQTSKNIFFVAFIKKERSGCFVLFLSNPKDWYVISPQVSMESPQTYGITR